MNISDEKLGAFLDQELSEKEMASIREAIRNDGTIAERLALLASAEALLHRHAAALDSRPMPDAVLAMLQPKNNADGTGQTEITGQTETTVQTETTDRARDKGPAFTADNVVLLSGWQARRQQAHQWLSQHAALAAGIALVVGFTGSQFLQPGGVGVPTTSMVAGTLDANVSNALDTTLSGQMLSIDDNVRLLSRFSFIDQQARHCRQFVLEHGTDSVNFSASENIACHTEQGWELVASAQVANANTGEYQTASGNSMLDSALDAMMRGSTLSLEEETALIADQWR